MASVGFLELQAGKFAHADGLGAVLEESEALEDPDALPELSVFLLQRSAPLPVVRHQLLVARNLLVSLWVERSWLRYCGEDLY